MAGRGQRFSDLGYDIPKPLIDIDGQPMIQRAASCLPDAEEWIFICRKDHEDASEISRSLKKVFPNPRIILLDQITDGQASTCMLAAPYLKGDECVNIGACDNAMIYKLAEWEHQLQDADVLVWTFRNHPTVTHKPEMYSWAEAQDDVIRKIHVKKPISNTPKNDHALIGAFTFKRSENLITCYAELHQANRRVNNEFYIDELVNVAIEKGLRAKVFEVDFYIGWGTPHDLETYHYWNSSLKRYTNQ